MLENFAIAASETLSILVFLYVTLGVLLGYFVGALPGMNRTTAIAVALPFTFAMSPTLALSFLIGINKGGAAGSAVSAILINVPGEPSSVVTTYDGYPMTRSGRARKALKIALFASVVGDVIATLILIALAQPLARFAVTLGPIELASILIFAITFIAAVSGESFFKALIAGTLGLMLSAPGIDVETGLPRLTFGIVNLYDGIPLLAVAIGTLALAEILVQIDKGWHGNYAAQKHEPDAEDPAANRLGPGEARRIGSTTFSGAIIGTLVGLLPGLGATLASFLSYTWARQRSGDPASFGKGAPEGVAASEAADNATVPASLIPVFAIGVPGSLSTALLMGAFLMHGLTPGPFLFRENADVVYGIYIGMLMASASLILVGVFGQYVLRMVIRTRQTVIYPVIVFLCVVGAYMESGTMFGVYLMVGFSFVGYFMKKLDFSFVTFVVGYVLGPMAELTIRQSLILTQRDPVALLQHPIALIFIAFTVFSIWRFCIAGLRRVEITQPSTADQDRD
jgi:putative tricarboxylic transport membrane protein